LGLIDKADVQNENPIGLLIKKYFMHGTSHHMGLDTHDYGILTEPMKAKYGIQEVEPGRSGARKTVTKTTDNFL
jgi:Xaa-Pro aminopeptidase